MKQRETMEKKLLITIDGPAGSGKSTLGRLLSQKLSYLYLDTGALYRAVAYKIIGERGNPEDLPFLRALTEQLELNLEARCGDLRVILDRMDVTDRLRTEEIGLMASKISALPEIREALLPIQRKFGSRGGVIAEGRDMGTVVFPQADVKFFLSATVSERALRRYRELTAAGLPSTRKDIEYKLILRDRQDTERLISPLKIPEDGQIIDSTGRTIEEVTAVMLNAIKAALS